MAHDKDGEHALQKLREAEKFARMLQDRIEPGDDLPEWLVEKFSLAASDLNEAFQYLDNKGGEEEELRKVVRQVLKKMQ